MRSSGSGRDRPDRLRRGLVLGAAGAALAACTAPAAAPPASAIAERTVASRGGATLRFLEAGQGPPVVLLHGASGNARDWTFGAMQAMARRHRVIAFHRPGLGGSEAPPGAERIAVQADIMAEAAQRLGLTRPILVGHSFGGAVALAWALDRPDTVRGLVLIGAPSQVWPGGLGMTTELLAGPATGPLLAAIAPILPRAVPEAAAARIFAPQRPPDGYLDRLGLGEILAPAVLLANARQLAALRDGIAAMVPRYAGLALPVEILHGDADAVVPADIHARPLAAQLPDARLHILAGIGHMPHHAALPDVMAALARLDGAA
jgi:pimeloyl-ACP methyl ester carboxylesterase